MSIECRESGTREPDLCETGCLEAVIRHLGKELRVDGIVLDHYKEKHYGRRTLEVLQEVIGLSSLMDQLSGQTALPEFSSLSNKEIQLRCQRCPFNPSVLFTRMKELLLGDLPNIDFPAFAAEFTVKAKELERHRYIGCQSCVSRNVDDLSFLLGQIESFSQKVIALNPKSSPK